jgi:hypothetical protein
MTYVTKLPEKTSLAITFVTLAAILEMGPRPPCMRHPLAATRSSAGNSTEN